MKKNKLFIIPVVILLCVAAVVYYNRYTFYQFLPAQLDDNYSTVNGIMMNGKDQIPFTGRLKTDLGNRIEIYSYKDGKLDGLNVAYQNGKIKEIGHWKDGMQNGVFKLYTEKGILVDEATFKNEKRDGITKQYYDDTGNIKVEVYYSEGVLNGLAKEYYQNKKLYREIIYSYGKKEGLTKEYYENGKTKIEMYYELDVPNGSYKMYDINGQIQLEGRFENGEFVPESNEEISIEEIRNE